MNKRLRIAFRPLLWSVLMSLLLVECKKTEDTPVKPTPTPQTPTEIKLGENVGLGAILLSKEEYAKLPSLPDPQVGARLAAGSKDPNLPTSYDMSAKMPPVGMQGMQGSCTTWAVVYAARSYFNATAKSANYFGADGKRNDDAVFSPAFVHNQARESGDCLKGGTYIFKALDLLKTAGVCTLKDMPYSDSDCTTQPTTEQKQKAANYKIKSWGRININTNTFRRFLYFDYPIIIAQNIDKYFDQLVDKDATGEYLIKTYTGEGSRGPHAMVIVGYDDTRKAFKIQNSWSEKWANKGYVWVSYDLIDKVIPEAYVMIPGEIGPDFRQPTVKTEAAGAVTDGQIELKGSVTSLGDLPFLGYGICVSATQQLPTEQVEVKNRPITVLPQAFSVKVPATGGKLYYRAFAETTGGIVYGDTISVNTKATTSDATRQAGTLIVHTPKSVYAVNTATGEKKWSFTQTTDLGEGGVISPDVNDNRYFVGARNAFYALNLQSGQVIWESTAKTNAGTMPVINASRRLIYSVDGSTVYALDYQGDKKWEYATDSSPYKSVSANLTVAGDLVFVTDSYKGKLLALDAATGQLKREFNGGSLLGNPTVVNNTLYSITTDKVVAYDVTTGNLQWEVIGSFGKDQSPTVYNNTLFVTTGNGTSTPRLLALDTGTGKTKWSYNLYDPASVGVGGILVVNDPNAANNIVIVKTNDVLYSDLYALDVVTGQLKWRTGSGVTTAPINTGSNVFLLNTYADGSRPGSVTVYDAQNGKVIWALADVKVAGTLSFATPNGQIFYITKSGMKQ